MFFFPPSTPNPQYYQGSTYGYRTSGTSAASYAGNLYYDYVSDGGKVYERFAFGAKEKFNSEFFASDNLGYEAQGPILGFHVVYYVAVYDRKNRRFMQRSNIFPNNALMPISISASTPRTPFDPLNLGAGMELIHAENGFTVGTWPYIYMIFNNTVENKWYFLQATQNPSPGSGNFTPTKKYELPFTPDLRTSYAMSLLTPAMFVSIDSKIKSFDTASKIVLDAVDFGAGNEVTKIWIEPYIIRDANNRIVLSRYRLYAGVNGPDVNGNGKTGSVYIYTVNANNTLTFETSYKNIAGKIVDFTWKR
jgi:hypothetical protein